ncbi:formate/nitrite transporter family protein [Halorussus caseinilyticus]|uniref:Formate/nitrite transporter family protein n=1 Tax=Halorussus caseinilyticus TaxID=3034025 RepID=A0ABD5WLP2_9EURY|nr:formate/nitrite transporter family protein [Halorussus sp. DT72]
MTVAPDPAEIFDRAVEEGERRLDQSLLELVATSFIAGFTVVFGVVALGIVEALVEPRYGHGAAKLAGSLAFGVALVFLVVGRTELFNENFFDPVAKAVAADDSWLVGPLVRLWTVTFALNFVGGSLFVAVLSVEGALPTGTPDALVGFAHEFVHRRTQAEFVKGIVGGTLVTLLSYLLEAVDSVGSRIALAYVVGVLLTLGVFDHVIVTMLHVVFGMFLGASIGLGELAVTTAVVTAGNLVGGLGLVTLTHVAQWKGARESDG